MEEKHYNTSITLAIDWADLDLFGHVNNVVFFRYVQAARVHYCEKIGLTSLLEDKLSFMVASSQCQFKKPLLYPGQVDVSVRADWIKHSSFELQYRIHKGGDLIAEASDILVVFDHHLKTKVTMPDVMRKRVGELENWMV